MRMNRAVCISQSKLELAEVRSDLAMAADIRYGSLPEVEATIKAAQRARPAQGLLSEMVTPEDIAKASSLNPHRSTPLDCSPSSDRAWAMLQ